MKPVHWRRLGEAVIFLAWVGLCIAMWRRW